MRAARLAAKISLARSFANLRMRLAGALAPLAIGFFKPPPSHTPTNPFGLRLRLDCIGGTLGSEAAGCIDGTLELELAGCTGGTLGLEAAGCADGRMELEPAGSTGGTLGLEAAGCTDGRLE